MQQPKHCPFCFSSQRILQHHIIPLKLGGSADPENSMYVCNSCHGTLENMTKKYMLGFEGWSARDIEKTLKIYEKAKLTEEGERHRRMLVFLLEVVIPRVTARWVTKK